MEPALVMINASSDIYEKYVAYKLEPWNSLRLQQFQSFQVSGIPALDVSVSNINISSKKLSVGRPSRSGTAASTTVLPVSATTATASATALSEKMAEHLYVRSKLSTVRILTDHKTKMTICPMGLNESFEHARSFILNTISTATATASNAAGVAGVAGVAGASMPAAKQVAGVAGATGVASASGPTSATCDLLLQWIFKYKNFTDFVKTELPEIHQRMYVLYILHFIFIHLLMSVRSGASGASGDSKASDTKASKPAVSTASSTSSSSTSAATSLPPPPLMIEDVMNGHFNTLIHFGHDKLSQCFITNFELLKFWYDFNDSENLTWLAAIKYQDIPNASLKSNQKEELFYATYCANFSASNASVAGGTNNTSNTPGASNASVSGTTCAKQIIEIYKRKGWKCTTRPLKVKQR